MTSLELCNIFAPPIVSFSFFYLFLFQNQCVRTHLYYYFFLLPIRHNILVISCFICPTLKDSTVSLITFLLHLTRCINNNKPGSRTSIIHIHLHIAHFLSTDTNLPRVHDDKNFQDHKVGSDLS